MSASSGISGIASLDAMIAQVRGAATGPEYVQAVAGATTKWLRGELARGVDPNTGAAWAPKKDGGKPLRNAAEQPQIRIAGKAVIVVLSGHYVFQHFPTRGRVARRVIPQGRMPPELGNAIRLGMIAPFEAKTKKGKRGHAATEARAAR